MLRSEDIEVLRWYSNSVFDELALCRMDKGQIDRHDDYLDLDCVEQAQEEALDAKNWIVLETKKREYPAKRIIEIGKHCEQLYEMLENLKISREIRGIKPAKEPIIVKGLKDRIEEFAIEDLPERF